MAVTVVRTFFIICGIFILIPVISLLRYLFFKGENGRYEYNLTDSWGYSRFDYGGEDRYIDGIPLSSQEDLERWWVLKGFSDALAEHLHHLESEMVSGRCGDIAYTKSEWHVYYARYRSLCVRHKIWNGLLEERTPFIPTEDQLEKENSLYHRIAQCAEIGKFEKNKIENERREYEKRCSEIIEYINAKYKHVAIRHQMITTLSKGDPSLKLMWQKVCKRMVKDGILAVNVNPDGKYIVRKKRKSSPKILNEAPILEKSEYSNALYALVPQKTLYKVEYTVGAPGCVDKENGTCIFISQSNGTQYHTSLSQCSCPAFSNNNIIPCKHMAALAMYLGHYHPA